MGSYARSVFDECAYDLLTALAEEKGKDVDSVSVSRSLAMEIALDAGRLENDLKRSKNPLITEDLIKRVSDASYEQMKKLVRPFFPYARYGT